MSDSAEALNKSAKKQQKHNKNAAFSKVS